MHHPIFKSLVLSDFEAAALILCWSDSDLDERICDDCAECLIKAEHTVLKLNLDRPSQELIDRNP